MAPRDRRTPARRTPCARTRRSRIDARRIPRGRLRCIARRPRRLSIDVAFSPHAAGRSSASPRRRPRALFTRGRGDPAAIGRRCPRTAGLRRERIRNRVEAPGCIRCCGPCVARVRAPRTEPPPHVGKQRRAATHEGEARSMITTLLELVRRVLMTPRGIILGSLLALAIAAPGHALVKKVPIVPGSNQLIPYRPPYTPPPAPTPPGSLGITQRTPFSISLIFSITDPSATANAIERSGADGAGACSRRTVRPGPPAVHRLRRSDPIERRQRDARGHDGGRHRRLGSRLTPTPSIATA